MKSKLVLNQKISGKTPNSRRNFIKVSGLAMAGAGLLISCDDDDMITDPNPEVFDLGGGDLGVLNYAYALEQLESAFYTRVVNGSYWSGASGEEQMILEDLYNHEVNHREFFKAALNANFSEEQILPESLEFNFADVDFSSRDSVLGTAKVLEDTGVLAYNGAGRIIETADYLVMAGKIVSVEARHAAAIRSILGNDMDDYLAFAGDDIVDSNGLDGALNPSEIIQAAGGFFSTPFTANQLP
ncbi:ferritin-like domain-containing protein [Membranihabitans maritimus]|uniref:ferritin-like domain-containing protein n=1 Tax=Membranihabitans maritimus TaxID=2904244 RepID=UPI001F1BFEEB|nr:ferritin-like domain-containing protein [Membranihabitans maritimus]